jgi:hypothetical protein
MSQKPNKDQSSTSFRIDVLAIVPDKSEVKPEDKPKIIDMRVSMTGEAK